MMKESEVSDLNLQSSPNVLEAKKTAQPEFTFDPFEELDLRVDKSNPKDVQELNEIVIGILDYPSDRLAEFHAEAMRLGNYDIQDRNVHEKIKEKAASQMSEQTKVCLCCGFKRHIDTIPVCTSFDSISNIGTSTYLFFATFKNLSILLILLTVFYSVYAIITNVIASKNNSKGNQYTIDYLTISLASKQNNDTTQNRTFYFIQAWIGMAVVIIWIIIFFVNRYRESKQAQEYDDASKSASDYSIVMEGMPLDVTTEEIQKSFTEYFHRISRIGGVPKNRLKQLTIKKMNIGKPFFMSEDELKDKELEDLIKQSEQIKDTFRKWIKDRQSSTKFSESDDKRAEIKKRYAELQKKKADKFVQQAKKLSDKLKEEKSDQLTTIFVSFQTNLARDLVLSFHELNFISRVKAICGDERKYCLLRGDTPYTPFIQRAPEPEDIIWPNIGRSDCNTGLRKLLIYTVTLVLLGICFLIVYELSMAQQNNGDRLISIAISAIIAIINFSLGFTIKILTLFEKDYTSTNRQASLAVKSIIAQMINSILTPIITAYYVKKNTGVYRVGGLVDNIFMMAFTNSLLPPLITLIDPYNIYVKIMRCLKSTTGSKLTRSQKQHNALYEGIEFEVGSQYIYIVNLFMFACFFVSLQPIVSVIALIGYVLMYWVEKYCLFNRYRRPVPGSDFVNKAIYQLIFLGPMMYSLGSLTWSNFDPNGIPPEAIIPNLIALLFSVLLYIVPMNALIGCCRDESGTAKETKYDDERIFFSSEYDRANPSTSAEGISDFEKFREKKLEEIKKLPKEEQEKFQNQIIQQAQRGALQQTRPPAFAPSFFNPYQQFQPQPFMPYVAPYMYQNQYAAPMHPQAFQQQSFMPQMQMPMQMQAPMMPMQMMGGYGGYNANPFGYQQPQPAFGGYGGGFNPYQNFGYRY